MQSEIGRYFEGRLLETQKLLKSTYDVALGNGSDVVVWIDGRELVFGRGEPKTGRGFLRVVPGEARIVLSFPKGYRINDPSKRLKGPKNATASTTLGYVGELDMYLRRIITDAYLLED
jgi:hypothetical protein